MASPSQSGVFNQPPDPRVQQFTESVQLDRRLYAHDILGSQAHARMLAQVGLLKAEEAKQICDTLDEIGQEIATGKLPLRVELEDIHMHIESALIDRLGDVGRRLHTARSRNDQVATDLRLWARDEIDAVERLLRQLQKAFVGRCEADRDIVIPAYTHWQRAQPVLAPHYWLCYCEKFERDRLRLLDCRRRLNVSSLGAAALAGTSLPIDRHATAMALGFDDVARNSLDVSSDRDFVLELAFVLTLIAEHLSVWAEEWIVWSTSEFNVLRLPQAYCTGSSIMPHKVNPDVLELTRGKSARVVGNLQSLLVLMKGLPLAYNRDLQEDKRPLFDSCDTVRACLELAASIVAESTLNREEIAARLDRGHLDATTLMEALIIRGVPMRTAHHLVGTLVGEANRASVTLAQLPDAVFEKVFAEARVNLDASIKEVLGVANAVAAFQSYGSTGPQEVAKQVRFWQEQLGMTTA
ncbi:MAG: argininosuccinate lyase [Planctomycetales bacterium]|nr:argininosuccinate lyase [Planctomycetales bacterium]